MAAAAASAGAAHGLRAEGPLGSGGGEAKGLLASEPGAGGPLEAVLVQEALGDVPCSPLARDAYGVGILSIVQGFDILVKLQNPEQRVRAMAAVGWGIIILILNFSMQLGILIFTHNYVMEPSVERMQELYEEYHKEAFEDAAWSLPRWKQWEHGDKVSLCQFPLSKPHFFLTVLVLWSFAILGELRQCVRWMRDIRNLTPPPPGGDLIFAREGSGFIIHMRPALKWCILVFAVIPKLAVAIATWYFGCRMLASTSEFEDLILNSCALGFITSVDELIYSSLVPEILQLQVERTSIYTLRFQTSELERQWDEARVLNYLTSLGYLICAVAATSLYIWMFQNVLPGFQWDLTEPCIHLRHNYN